MPSVNCFGGEFLGGDIVAKVDGGKQDFEYKKPNPFQDPV